PRQRDRSPVRGNQTVRHPTRPRRRPSLPPQTCFVSSVSIVARQTRSATTVSSLRSSHQAANRVSNYRRLRPVLSAELPAELSAEVVFCFPEPPLLAGPAEPLPCFPPPEPAPLFELPEPPPFAAPPFLVSCEPADLGAAEVRAAPPPFAQEPPRPFEFCPACFEAPPCCPDFG